MFFLSYWQINNRLPVWARNLFVIISSYIFYGWWDPRFLGLIVLSSVTDYIIGILLHSSDNQAQKKRLLFISVAINLSMLGFFKYFNFFSDSFQQMFEAFGVSINATTLNIILPVGISFYTFQTMSYTIDVYRNELKPTNDALSFFAFVSFFPQLVAGPIERARNLLPQFYSRKKFSYPQSIHGLRLIVWGLFKKVVIADNLGLLADQLLAPNESISGLSTLLGILFFAFQIYADFSGYSDIAIGIARMLGIQLRKNFQTPYFASSFNEFWRRWHISLSTWFRDYVYIPLGGNRNGKYSMYFNLFLTFLLSGLWHGAQFTFVIWGGLHGLILIAEKRINRNLLKKFNAIFVFAIVTLLWIPFRAESTAHLMQLSLSIVDLTTYSTDLILKTISEYSNIRFTTLMVVLLLFIVLESQLFNLDFAEWLTGKSVWVRYGFYYGLVALILGLINLNVKPDFIYFQF